MSLINRYRLHEKDTGSTAVQIISLNTQIQKLIEHGKHHRKANYHEERKKSDKKRKKNRWKDVPAQRALIEKKAKEEKLLKYFAEHQPELYTKLKEELK